MHAAYPDVIGTIEMQLLMSLHFHAIFALIRFFFMFWFGFFFGIWYVFFLHLFYSNFILTDFELERNPLGQQDNNIE